MFTYEDYRNNVCTYNEFYCQFVTENIIKWVKATLGVRVLNSTDPHFNDIELRYWDSLSPCILIKKSDKDLGLWDCLASRVCILKQAARILKERENV
jgi:hypothetical protein